MISPAMNPIPLGNPGPAWKDNWRETQQRFARWWRREGLLVGMWGSPRRAGPPREDLPPTPPPASLRDRYCSAAYRTAENHRYLAGNAFPAEIFPLAAVDLGPGSLALWCGSEPGFTEDTVWFHSCIEDVPEPERLPPLRFDPAHPWWRVTEDLIRAGVERGRGRYLVGCPDLIENLDTLSSLRGGQTVCLDLIERPAWVRAKIDEINQVWFEAYQRIYDLIRTYDGWSAFNAFYVLGPGKTAKLQCDSSAMLSPAMFREFVVPGLTEQCEWLDCSLYHLDGTQAMGHLDALMGIEALDAIEWTPQAGLEGGGHPRWYDLYRRILAGGKCVQVVGIEPAEVPPLLDAIGRDGVYLLVNFRTESEVHDLLRQIGPY